MKHLHTLVGLLLIGLFTQHGLADISLTLRNGARANYRRAGGQPYLPPQPSVKSVVSNEKYFNVRESGSHQQNFEESNYGNSRYQIFEVHNHYEPSVGPSQTQSQGNDATQSNYEAQGYLPPHQEIHIQHVNEAQDSNDDSLDVSYLSFAAAEGLDGQQITIAEHAPSVPTPTTAVPVPFPSNFQHDFQKKNREPITQKIHVEHHEVSQQQHPINAQSEQNVRQSNYRASDYLPPHESVHNTPAAPEFRAPDHLPPQREEHHQQHHFAGDVHQQQPRFEHFNLDQKRYKGPDYLPPHNTATPHEIANVRQQNFGSQGQGRQVHTSSALNKPEFHAQEYLPPHTETQQEHHAEVQRPTYQQYQEVQTLQQQQQSQNQQQQQQYQPAHVAQSNYKGPDYLPPNKLAVHEQQHQNYNVATHESVSPVRSEYKGPDYLPPHFSSVASHEARHNEQHTEAVVHTEYKSPGYLPPGYDFVNPEERQPEVSARPEQLQQVQQQQHPLPQHEIVAQRPSIAPTSESTYRAPGFLPSGYEINKPVDAEQAIAQLHSQDQQQSRHLQQPQSEQQYQQHQEVVVQAQIQVGGREQGSDIVYGRPKQQQQVQTSTVQHSSFQGNAYLPPHTAAHLPPVPVAEPQSPQNYQVQHGHVQNVKTLTTSVQQQYAQQYHHQQQHSQVEHQQPQLSQLQPQQQQPKQQHYTQQVSPQFFPNDEPVQQVSLPMATPVALGFKPPAYMHSLSSYMTTVQPFERYGDAQFTEPRRPFAEYGPPPRPRVTAAPFRHSQTLPAHSQPQQTLEVAPMYREQSTRPQYYAPTMSYTANAVPPTYSAGSPLLSAQAKQSLQKFMPRDIQQHIIAPSTSGKIRTVQIVNPTAVKTLKVLETSDHAGVKTIKILGTSNEDPMGEHRIVKVVSQNAQNGQENHVQTVKIFNDHKDVVIPAAAPAVSVPVVGHSHQRQLQHHQQQHNANGNRNAYLPPAAPRKQRSARVSPQQKHKRRPIIAAKSRRRY